MNLIVSFMMSLLVTSFVGGFSNRFLNASSQSNYYYALIIILFILSLASLIASLALEDNFSFLNSFSAF